MNYTNLIDDKNYLVINNNEIVYGNYNSLDFDKSDDYKISCEIDKDTHHVINIKKGKAIKLLEIIDIKDGNYDLVINIEDGASLDYTSLRKSNSDTNINIIINLGDGAILNTKHINIFSKSLKFREELNAKGIHSDINSMDVVINCSGCVQTYDIASHHTEDASNCYMRNYVINNNTSITHMNTNGFIENGTKGVVISQKTKGLLLDLNSEISANPLLCISEYDCNASHGASIGAINEEELYYLMSRGLTKEDSERLIVQGFINPFILGLDNENLKNFILEETNKIL